MADDESCGQRQPKDETESSARSARRSLSSQLVRWTGVDFLRRKMRKWRFLGSRPSNLYGQATVASRSPGDDTYLDWGRNFSQKDLFGSRGSNEDSLQIASIQVDQEPFLPLKEYTVPAVVVQSSLSYYTFIRTVGVGSFSKVKLVAHKYTGALLAIKQIEIEALSACPRLLLTVRREIEILRSLPPHPNIVKFKEVVQTEQHLCILMEWVEGGELFELVSSKGSLDEATARIVMRQLVAAVRFLHANGVVHRDLKLENVLVDYDGNHSIIVKLADFGLARQIRGSSLDAAVDNVLSTRCGSEEYAAPEIIRGDSYDGRLADAWSLGVILYACLLGVLPFNSDPHRPKGLYDRICNGRFSLKEGLVSKEAEHLIRSILRSEPAKRLTVDGIARHPWLC